jgi:transcriptional regulator with XRE-family HTH domain
MKFDFVPEINDIYRMKLNIERLVKARGLANLTQQGLADAAGVSVTAIASYESGKLSPRKTTIYRLAKALNVEPDWLSSSDDTSSDDTDVPIYLPHKLAKELEIEANNQGISTEDLILKYLIRAMENEL